MPRYRRVIRYNETAETPQLNWAQELAGYGINLKPEKPVEQISMHEVAGKVIAENKPLTLKRAIELGAAAGCETMTEIHAAVPGSFAAHAAAISAALDKKLPQGINTNMSADVRVSSYLGAMPQQVLLKVWEPVKDGNKTTYYMVDVSLDKDGNISFGAAEEMDVTAQFMPVDISKGNAQKKTERQRVAEIQENHAKNLARDSSFFENVARKQDRAEKRERLPRRTGTLTGSEFMAGVSAAVAAKPTTSIEIGTCLAEVARGTTRISEIPAEFFSEVYAIAENHVTVADGKIVGACDSSLVADRLITGAGGQSFYIPAQVLRAAVETAQAELPMFCYAEHKPELRGGDDPTIACALIKTIEFDERTGSVKLPRIEFLEDSDGAKVILETARSGKKYGISARFAKGGAWVHRSGLANQNETHEYQNLRILGFDIVTRPGIRDAELYWL